MNELALNCPIPDYNHGTKVEEDHGHGSKAMSKLIADMQRWYGHEVQVHTDAACVPLPQGATSLSMTTDGHILSPYQIPGCNIGELAIIGSVNDTVVSGALPYYVAVYMRLTVGFPLSELQMVCESMGRTARDIGVAIVTGDTKVVPQDMGDGIEITTTVVGAFTKTRIPLQPTMVQPGDVAIVTGVLGRHYVAVAVARSEGKLVSPVTSDMRSLHKEVAILFDGGIKVRFMHDLTRGGLLDGVVGIAEHSGTNIVLDERRIPHHPAALAACKKWGHEILACPNEGTMIVFVDPRQAPQAIDLLRKVGSPDACVIGEVHPRDPGSRKGEAILRTTAGTERTLVQQPGKMFNRIC